MTKKSLFKCSCCIARITSKNPVAEKTADVEWWQGRKKTSQNAREIKFKYQQCLSTDKIFYISNLPRAHDCIIDELLHGNTKAWKWFVLILISWDTNMGFMVFHDIVVFESASYWHSMNNRVWSTKLAEPQNVWSCLCCGFSLLKRSISCLF